MKINKEKNSENQYSKQRKMTNIFDSNDEEDLYLGSSDEKRLEAMTEKERQKILYERHSKIKAMKEKAIIEQKLNEIEKKQPTAADSLKVSKIENNFDIFCTCVIKRDFIIDNIYKPFLQNWIGNLIRFKINEDYYIGKVRSYIHDQEVYDLPKPNGVTKTDVVFELDAGFKVFRRIRIAFLSNAPPTQSDYEDFLKNNPNFDLNTQLNKVKSTNFIMKKPLTESEHIKMLTEKRSLYSDPNKRIILRKIKLIKERDEAIEAKKFEKAEEIQRVIDGMNVKPINKEEEVWKKVSERNRKINAQNARRYELY